MGYFPFVEQFRFKFPEISSYDKTILATNGTASSGISEKEDNRARVNSAKDLHPIQGGVGILLVGSWY